MANTWENDVSLAGNLKLCGIYLTTYVQLYITSKLYTLVFWSILTKDSKIWEAEIRRNKIKSKSLSANVIAASMGINFEKQEIFFRSDFHPL